MFTKRGSSWRTRLQRLALSQFWGMRKPWEPHRRREGNGMKMDTFQFSFRREKGGGERACSVFETHLCFVHLPSP